MTHPHIAVGHAIKRLQNRHHNAVNAALSELGITIVQWDALRHLEQNPDASLHDLAQLTFQTDQSFGTLAGRLLERQLVERVPGPGRAVKHRLTERGRELRWAGEALVDGVLTESLGSLSPKQLETLHSLLHQLLNPPK